MKFEQLTGLGGLTGQSALWAGNVASPNEKRPGDCEFHSGRGVGGRDKSNQRVAYCLMPYRNSRVALVGTKTAAERL